MPTVSGKRIAVMDTPELGIIERKRLSNYFNLRETTELIIRMVAFGGHHERLERWAMANRCQR